jgi:hypothetical protein
MSAHHDVRVPGRLVMRLASRCFDEPGLSAIIQPAVADYQREVFEADGHGVAARIRGTVALAKVLVLAALLPRAGAGAPLTRTLLGLNGASSLALLAPILYLGVSPMFGPFVAGAVVAGVALAVALNSWNSQHPTAVACTRRIYSKDPEINISSVPVGGNIGGFFFVAASTLTILLGLPELRWFVVGAVSAGAAMAWGLAAWHRTHTDSATRRIVVH